MPLLDRSGAKLDLWTRVERIADGCPTHALLSLAALPDALSVRQSGQKLGVEVPNTEGVAALVPLFGALSLISIVSKGFADGRGFSLARLIRRNGYEGLLRANGPLIADQFPYAIACGFDEVELPDDLADRQPAEQWLAATWRISNVYQRGYLGHGSILDRRRRLRERLAASEDQGGRHARHA